MTLYYLNFRAMGCDWHVQLDGEDVAYQALQQLPAKVQGLEDCLTRFDDTSDLMRFNQQAGDWVAVNEMLFANLQAAKQAARLTDGLYNPMVLPNLVASGYDRSFEALSDATESKDAPLPPHWHRLDLDVKAQQARIPADSAVDLGGIAKGWSAQSIATHLSTYGSVIVAAGGDVVTRGAPASQTGWLVEIETYGEPITVSLSDHAIVTSGIDYRQWHTANGEQRHHIIDPRSGLSAQSDVLSVTIIHADATLAEAYAKAVLIMGSQAGLAWLHSQWHCAGLVVLKDGTVLTTENFLPFVVEQPVEPLGAP